MNQLKVRFVRKAFLNAVFEHFKKGFKIAVHIVKSDRLLMDADLRPSEHFKQLFKRAEASGHRDKAVS